MLKKNWIGCRFFDNYSFGDLVFVFFYFDVGIYFIKNFKYFWIGLMKWGSLCIVENILMVLGWRINFYVGLDNFRRVWDKGMV